MTPRFRQTSGASVGWWCDERPRRPSSSARPRVIVRCARKCAALPKFWKRRTACHCERSDQNSPSYPPTPPTTRYELLYSPPPTLDRNASSSTIAAGIVHVPIGFASSIAPTAPSRVARRHRSRYLSAKAGSSVFSSRAYVVSAASMILAVAAAAPSGPSSAISTRNSDAARNSATFFSDVASVPPPPPVVDAAAESPVVASPVASTSSRPPLSTAPPRNRRSSAAAVRAFSSASAADRRNTSFIAR
eukprot:30753-Pelagococcus_subviridis.AAC.2